MLNTPYLIIHSNSWFSINSMWLFRWQRNNFCNFWCKNLIFIRPQKSIMLNISYIIMLFFDFFFVFISSFYGLQKQLTNSLRIGRRTNMSFKVLFDGRMTVNEFIYGNFCMSFLLIHLKYRNNNYK